MAAEYDLNSLASICVEASIMKDAGIEYIYIPNLKIHIDNKVRTFEALLCTTQHGGYTTRLFLSEPVPNKGRNWTVHNILSRAWHTWSWNHVPAHLDPMQILSAHVRALK